MSALHPLLDIDDALVSDLHPAQTNGPLDYERCARLHNYIVAYGWMAYHGREPHELDELLIGTSSGHSEYNVPLDRLDPALVSFLGLIILPGPGGFFYWVDNVEIRSADETFFENDNNLDDMDRFVIIYGTRSELGSHCVGLVFDQQEHRVAMTLTIENTGSASPVDEHPEMWFPLETMLTNWIHMIRIAKIIAGPEGEWGSYSPSQVDSAVAAMDQLSAAIEERIPPESLLSVSWETPILTDAELNAASVPESCFIRSFLTRVKTPRFKTIAPGLEVPHDAAAFAARQKFTNVPHNHDGIVIPPVLIFAAHRTRTIGFNEEIRWLFLGPHDDAPYKDNDPIPTGLYSESIQRGHYDNAEEGFRLLLPFPLRTDAWNQNGARYSTGELVKGGSVADLFQAGGYYPFGGEWRAQRLEKLLDRWRELVESGVWIVGLNGVEGDIDRFQDADHGAWQDYWIPPGW